MNELLAVLSGLIVFGTTVPYFMDILRGKVVPLRSTRLMFMLLIVLAFFQQRSLGVGLAMMITIAELAGSILLFVTSMKKGVGGTNRLDIVCYVLLGASLVAWYTTGDPYIALLFTIVADFVAFFPVIYRTAKDPKSETQLFYWGGVVGPLLVIAVDTDRSAKNIIFVAYLAIINGFVALLINRQYLKKLRPSVR